MSTGLQYANMKVAKNCINTPPSAKSVPPAWQYLPRYFQQPSLCRLRSLLRCLKQRKGKKTTVLPNRVDVIGDWGRCQDNPTGLVSYGLTTTWFGGWVMGMLLNFAILALTCEGSSLPTFAYLLIVSTSGIVPTGSLILVSCKLNPSLPYLACLPSHYDHTQADLGTPWFSPRP